MDMSVQQDVAQNMLSILLRSLTGNITQIQNIVTLWSWQQLLQFLEAASVLVLQVLERDSRLLAHLLSKSLFFVCRNMNYNSFNEFMLKEFLCKRFPHSQSHVISMKNEINRVINFVDVVTARQAWEEVGEGGLHWLGTVNLRFFQPSGQLFTRLLHISREPRIHSKN